MMSRPIASIFVALLVVGATPAAGNGQTATSNAARQQTSAFMTPGARVRVKLPGEHAWEGTLVSLADDSMLVRGTSGADTTLVRLSQVKELYVSAGRQRSRHLVRNTTIGVVLGSGLGWMVGRGMESGGCMKGDPCWENFCFLCPVYASTPYPPIRDHATAGTVVGGLVGGTLGLLVSRVGREDWRPVRRGTQVSLTPWRGGVAIAYSARR